MEIFQIHGFFTTSKDKYGVFLVDILYVTHNKYI